MQTIEKIINLEYLRIMSDGDKDMEMTMLEMLLEELPSEFDKMKALHRESNWEELGGVSHKMKSTLAFTGNEEVAAANRQIEQMAKHQPDAAQIEILLNLFEDRLPAIMEALRMALETD